MGSQTRWLLHLTIVSALLSLPAAKDSIAPGELVRDADSLISADGRFRLGFFTPGSSKSRYLGIWFNTVSVRTVIWVANGDRPISDSSGAVLSISGDGSLVLADANGTVYWSTGAAATGAVDNPVATLLNSSNFVVTGANGGDYAWQSFDHLTDSMVPGMKLGWSRSIRRNLSLRSWKSNDDPAPGEYATAMDVRGDPQLFLMRGTNRIWRTGPWIGKRFTGIPGMTSYETLFKFEFSNDADEVAFSYDTIDHSVLSRLVLNPTGAVERVVWNENTQTWNRYWFAPKDECDSFGTCGPFGVCDTSDFPVCHCVRGFVPRSPENWNKMDASDGCVRRTPLDCRNGTDGFVKVAQVKLPDTSTAALVNYTMGLEECRAACLRNCSCKAYANAQISGGGSGCILWVGNVTDVRVNANLGEDLFVRLAEADLGSSSTRAGRRWVAGVTVAAAVLGLLVLGWTGWCLWKRRTRRKTTPVVLDTTTGMNGHRNEERSRGNHEDLDVPLFDFSTIAAATDGFSAENKLGEGGFGPVFKGRMGDEQEVAVKRLARNSTQGVEEFKNEVVLIAKLQHRNLVRLLGCCIQWEERMLVYEYMPNGSLDAFLFDKTKGSLLDWKSRYHIINDIARGLLYLHQDSRFRIIHRDLKASNILLDKEMNAKISDFGMARIFGGGQTEANTRRVVGTYGYMSPEYIMDGVFSVKSDVFSFGVLVLEIVSGKRNRGVYHSDPNLNLLGYAWSLWKAGNLMELVDASMPADGFLLMADQVLRCINLGLLCVQERPEGRPTMAWVVQMLGSDTATSQLPQPKQPGFMATRGPFEVSSSGSVNEVTVTMFEGR